jgi:molybdopterin/thiamine biosynthesis adenylyltransferase
MNDFGCVVVPADLVLMATASNQNSGWFGGSRLESERVYVVSSLSIGEGEKKTSKHAGRLLSHRFYRPGAGEIADELIEWVQVPKGFGETLLPFRERDRFDLEAELGIDLDKKLKCFCTIEETDKFPKVRAFCILSDELRVVLGPVSVTVLSRPTPYYSLPADAVDVLARKRVAIVGVGSGGSEIALNLGCAGVGVFLLFDGDRLERTNYNRHVLDRQDLARTKVEGLKSAFSDRELPSKVIAIGIDVIWWADEFRKALKDAEPDLLICATDSRESRRLINYTAVKLGIPLIVAGILEQDVGEVLLVDPGRTACYECVRLELGASLQRPASDERSASPYSGGEQNNLQSAVYRLDVHLVASLSTRVALGVLDAVRYKSLPANYIVWGRESTEYAPPFRFDVPFSLNYVPIAKRLDCPVCGSVPDEIKEVNIDDRFSSIFAELDSLSS